MYTSTGDDDSNMSSADEDNIINAICGHGELTMSVHTVCVCHCVCVCVCLCVCVLLVRVCVCVNSVTVCLNVRV